VKARAHPFVPNSAPGAAEEMLRRIGVDTVEELFTQIPESDRLQQEPILPPAITSEGTLRRHLLEVLDRNEHCERNLSFLGGGCWQHYVPAVCDEIVGRAEFVTPVWGTPMSDHGRNQAWFEFTSQLGELLDLDFVGLPVYSWGCAAGHAIRMAQRLNGRRVIVAPRSIDPERLAVMRTYCGPVEMPGHLRIRLVDFDPKTGALDLDALAVAVSDETAAVYVDNPSYLGVFEENVASIVKIAHDHGAEAIVGVDPVSLGIIRPPGAYGADIAVGSTQPLGVHMNCGGGAGGFIATRDEERYARTYPTLNVSIFDTARDGEHGFALTLFEQTSYGARELGNDWTGNSVYLWAIANAVYMSLLGPQGFAELGALVLQRSHYAARRLGELEGIAIRFPRGFFKEFVVSFDGAGLTVAEVNRQLRHHGIFGGIDLSHAFPELGQSALYCVTEVHAQEDIDALAAALAEVLRR
jgi:glycine dehydrogenase subunit 1